MKPTAEQRNYTSKVKQTLGLVDLRERARDKTRKGLSRQWEAFVFDMPLQMLFSGTWENCLLVIVGKKSEE